MKTCVLEQSGLITEGLRALMSDLTEVTPFEELAKVDVANDVSLSDFGCLILGDGIKRSELLQLLQEIVTNELPLEIIFFVDYAQKNKQFFGDHIHYVSKNEPLKLRSLVGHLANKK